jgi:hypothetical protein
MLGNLPEGQKTSAPTQEAAHLVDTLDVKPTASIEKVNAAIKDFWGDIKKDAYAQQAAVAAGLDRDALALTAPPFVACNKQSNYGDSIAFLIFLAHQVVNTLAHQAIRVTWEKLWEDYFWPRLRAKFGDELTRQK